MIPYVRIGLVLALLLATALGVRKYNSTIEANVDLQNQLATQAQEMAKQTEEIRALLAYNGILNATLKEKQSYEDAIRSQLGGINRKLNRLMESDPQVQAWGDVPLPSAVRGLLQDSVSATGRQDSVPESARGAAPTNPRSRPTTEGGPE